MALVTRRKAAGLLALLALAARVGASPEPRAAEYEVKAAYLYNFAKFVEWPAGSSRETFVLGILGRDPFGPLLDHVMAGKVVGNRRLVVKRLSSLDEVEGIDVLFVAASESVALPEIVKRLEGTATLTVGESEGFVGRGGMVGFRVVGDVVRFDVDLDQA